MLEPTADTPDDKQDAWPMRPPMDDLGHAFGGMINQLRDFLDKVAGARPDAATIEALTADLARWSTTLEACKVDERQQLYARLIGETGRGQTTAPALVIDKMVYGDFRGRVTFGRYFLGVNGAVHGGAIPLLFDEVLGRVVGKPGQRARTAYLNTNFRALTPLDTELEVVAWVDRSDGRKHFARGEIRHGDVVCADCEGLFIALRSDQK